MNFKKNMSGSQMFKIFLGVLSILCPIIAFAIDSGGAESGILIDDADTQEHSFVASAGDSAILGISGGGDNGAWIYAPSGTYLGLASQLTANLHNLPETGTYDVIVHRRANGGTPADYTLHFVKAPGMVEHGEIAAGVVRTGTLEHLGALDSYDFEAETGDELEIEISGGGNNGAWLYLPSGMYSSLATDDAIVILSAPESGTYSVIVHRRLSGGSGADTYSLLLTSNGSCTQNPTQGLGEACSNNNGTVVTVPFMSWSYAMIFMLMMGFASLLFLRNNT